MEPRDFFYKYVTKSRSRDRHQNMPLGDHPCIALPETQMSDATMARLKIVSCLRSCAWATELNSSPAILLRRSIALHE